LLRRILVVRQIEHDIRQSPIEAFVVAELLEKLAVVFHQRYGHAGDKDSACKVSSSRTASSPLFSKRIEPHRIGPVQRLNELLGTLRISQKPFAFVGVV
jgi:hypothetical protein